MIRLLSGDCREILKTLPSESVQCCVTSPPYWGLRDYGVEGQLGMERTYQEHIAVMVDVFREVRRVLRKDGTLFLNYGDCYATSVNGRSAADTKATGNDDRTFRDKPFSTIQGALKPKDLVMMPARIAIALQEDGWWVRSDIIWCLSGGTRVYARTQKGEMPMTIKDMVRLDPATVQLWNGEKWTQVLGWSETPRPDKTYEIEFRNGQRVGCTASHEWPVEPCGNIRTDELRIGDVVRKCRLPEPETPKSPAALDDEMVGWFVGLYIAEGSQSGDMIQIASHSNEIERFARLRSITNAFHGSISVHKTSENGSTVNVYGPMLRGLVETYVSGKLASGKHLHSRCWQRSDRFLRAVLDGYLDGDGHFDAANNRWRLGFCSNDELVADLRTIGARLGVSVRLRRYTHKIDDVEFPGYRGELRFTRSDHHNSRDDGEIVAIRESRARKFWDIGVSDESHLFALASGILTHNSKPNPMPESVTDRPASAHEHVFLLTKSARYFWDADAVRSPPSDALISQVNAGYNGNDTKDFAASGAQSASGTKARIISGYRSKVDKQRGHSRRHAGFNDRWDAMTKDEQQLLGANCRNVWVIATAPFSDAHFATFPPALVERCVLAGSSERGCCGKCGAPWGRVTERVETGATQKMADGWDTGAGAHGTTHREGREKGKSDAPVTAPVTLGWCPSCDCDAKRVPCMILDPFGGAGTTGLVADRLGRDAILIELNTDYVGMAARRLEKDSGLFADVVSA